MSTLGELKYTFETEWYDQQACVTREYRLIYFPNLRAVEMFDVKNNRQFLRRQEIPDISLDDFFIGSQVTILSRVLRVREYGDVHTRTIFEQDRQRTFAMVKPDAYNNLGKIIDAVFANGFRINKLKMSRFSPATAEAFYKEHKDKPFFPNLQQFMVTDVSIGMELVAQDAVSKWRECLGPTNSENARAQASGSLRALFGTDGTRNACHGSDSVGSFKRESDFWFSGGVAKNQMKTTAIFNNSALCLIKPHTIQEGVAGQIIDMILAEGFEISAMEMFYLTRPVIEEFYDVYKGVLPEYLPLIEHLSNGPTIALEIRQENAVEAFRKLAGPHDPEIAKHLRPNTIRAKFGHDRVKNAIHCTDMPEDGILEVKYFFEILQQHQ